ncbi:hypothetical protein [Paenisporosarcina cavernae]|uniref:Spore coat protein n=1 Tax=Paenisporosarcina cavernae TaxID=2320858 RepID=A0A385YVZ1_9BACL|nr:hypothetical protein [Paenisporosarcina cavernae]AYC30057.1 hypothetical protein D3873_09290 [Paenisporosarcina cavernae]
MNLFQSNQTEQIPYPTVPKMISSKDLSYIKDMHSWNMNVSKKMTYYASQVSCEKLRSLFEDAAKTHETHNQRLQSVLKAHEGGLQQ